MLFFIIATVIEEQDPIQMSDSDDDPPIASAAVQDGRDVQSDV